MVHGAAEAEVGRVGFIIQPQIATNVISRKIISSRVDVRVMNVGKRTTLIVVAMYVSTSASENKEVERFYVRLGCVVQRKSTFTVMLGDFKAKLGRREESERYIGNFGIGKNKRKGQSSANFAESGKLCALNSFLTKRLEIRWTWRSPGDATKAKSITFLQINED